MMDLVDFEALHPLNLLSINEEGTVLLKSPKVHDHLFCLCCVQFQIVGIPMLQMLDLLSVC